MNCKGIFGINSPNNKKPTIFLKFRNRDFLNVLIVKTVILNSDTSGWLRAGELPWRIHHDDIEIVLADFELFFNELVKVVFGDICANGDGVFTNMRYLILN